ncbi:hypothetical protein D9M73_153500 [compost metagenome]
MQQFEDALGVLRVFAALVDIQVVTGGVDHAAGGVEGGELTLQFLARLEELFPRVVKLAAGHPGAVIGEPGGAPQVRCRELAARVEARVAERRFDVLEVGQGRGVDFQQQVLVDQSAHDRLRRHDHVVRRAAGLQLGQQGFVAVVAVHGDLDPGLLFELGQQLHRVVVGPVVEEQLLGLGGLGAERRERREATQGQTGNGETHAFHFLAHIEVSRLIVVCRAVPARRPAPPARWKSPASGSKSR